MRFLLRLIQAFAFVGVVLTLLTLVIDTLYGTPFSAVSVGGAGAGAPGSLERTLKLVVEPARYNLTSLMVSAGLFVLCEIALTLDRRLSHHSEDKV